MPDKNIPDLIQDILERNGGFMALSKLCEALSPDVQQSIGIKALDPVNTLRRKIESVTGDRFMFVNKGRKIYILIPCDPSEMVLDLLSSKKALSKSKINTLPFRQEQFADIVNDLVDEGKAIIKLDKKLNVQIFRTDSSHERAKDFATNDYTQQKFREAFDTLKKGRITVRICDLRKKLAWPREVFDEMLVTLRDSEAIELRTGDTATMTLEEIQDCFVDEHGFRRGLVIWNG